MAGRQILTVTGQAELRRLARDLRNPAIPRQIREELRAEMLKVGRSGAAQVRSALLANPSKGQSARRGRRSLRRKLASTVEVKLRVSTRPGVIIWQNPARMPAGEEMLVAYYEGTAPRWRHPTFKRPGRRSNWVNQRSQPTFYRTLDGIAGPLAAAGDKVLSTIANRIE